MGNRRRKEDEGEKRAPYFPQEIMHQIFARLPQECLNELRCMCKRWHELISSSKFIAHSFRHPQPALLVQVPTSDRSKKFEIKLLELDGERLVFKHKNLGMTRMGKVRSICNGLLLIDDVNDKRNLLVMNVLTKCYVTISHYPFYCPRRCGLALVFNPREKVYKVVHIYHGGSVELFTVGCSKNEWKVIPGPFSGPDQPPLNMKPWSDPLSTNGQLILHWVWDAVFAEVHGDVGHQRYIISFDTCEERFQRTELPCSFVEGTGTLLVMGDNLCFMHRTSSTQFDVWVLEDFKGQVWNKRCAILAESISYLSQGINKTPSFQNLVPLCSFRDGELIVFQHKNTRCWYMYETKLKVLKTLRGMPVKNPKLLLYRSSLVRWNNEEELLARETI